MTRQMAWKLLALLLATMVLTANAELRMFDVLGVESRTIGGVVTNPGEFRYMVSLRYPSGVTIQGQDVGGRHFCGGVLIDRNIVLTAAHCIKRTNLYNVEVHIGRFEREGDDEGRFQSMKTIDTKIHPEYNQPNDAVNDYDVALLVLEADSSFPTVRYMRNEEEMNPGTLGTVLGWGVTKSGDLNSQAETLMKVQVPVVSRTECQGKYSGIAITESMICAGEEGKDSCVYDSGGPLLINGKVAGLVSWGPADCGGSQPGVYSSVGLTAGWIQKQIRNINGACVFVGARWIPPGCNE